MQTITKPLSVLLILYTICANIISAVAQQDYISFTERNNQIKNITTIPQCRIEDFNTSGVEVEYLFTGAKVSHQIINNSEYDLLNIVFPRQSMNIPFSHRFFTFTVQFSRTDIVLGIIKLKDLQLFDKSALLRQDF